MAKLRHIKWIPVLAAALAGILIKVAGGAKK